MANFKIDHFVFAANTLSEGSNTIKKILDEDLSEINVHETMGTHNRVISLGSSYLEVIALDPKNQNANTEFKTLMMIATLRVIVDHLKITWIMMK